MIRKCYFIEGLVQGVGFRPYIYKTATQLSLGGFVKNDANGVYIEIEGAKKQIKKFQKKLKQKNLPKLAYIKSIKTKKSKPLYKEQFEIIQSTKINAKKIANVLPDIAICKDCISDIISLSHKRYYNYFATTCTNCGPRYSILQTVPYDRENTSMAKFKMCQECKKEYTNPMDRRYHAQPISCHNCGPKLNHSIKKAAKKIKKGKIVAIKGIGGFHIVCDATNDKTLQQLREYKNRPNKPFALMVKNIKWAKRVAEISKKEKKLLKSKEAPIVILKKQKRLLISQYVAPKIDRIGIFLPYTPLQYLLFGYLKKPIIATSANLGDEPIIKDISDIKSKLPFVDFILDFDRDIVNAVDDSLVQISNNKIQLLRGGRGFMPKSFKLPFKIDKKILAVGANQKSTIALAFDDNLILSPHIGDLNSIANVDFFQRTLQTFKKFYDFEPEIIICDKHPKYESTKWAKQQNIQIFEVQHHLAHIYATKAEFNLSGQYTGFGFDGTGYGDDATLWGGEVFVGDKRKYHFKKIKLLGGEKAIKEPRRVALSMLFEKYTLQEVLNFQLPFDQNEIKLLHKSYTNNLNAPYSTSVGRLFDAIASFGGLCNFQTYEGEAGLLCEMGYDHECKESFEFEISNGIIDINFDFFTKNIVSKFINTLVKIVLFISQKEGLDVILSGGVFQNKTLLELIAGELDKLGIKYYSQEKTPINDGGVSLGQIWYFLEKKQMLFG